MSLINEALKKAKRAQTGGSSAAGPAMNVADSGRHFDNAGGLWLPILIVAVLLLSGVFIWQWFASSRVDQVRARSTPEPVIATAPAPAPAPVAPPAQAAAPAPQDPIIPPASAPATESTTNLAVTSEPATPAPAPTPEPPKPLPVTYKLQGIFYRAKNPTAVINGKTVEVGSRVGDAHVIAIEKDAAFIVTASGQTNLLELP